MPPRAIFHQPAQQPACHSLRWHVTSLRRPGSVAGQSVRRRLLVCRPASSVRWGGWRWNRLTRRQYHCRWWPSRSVVPPAGLSCTRVVTAQCSSCRLMTDAFRKWRSFPTRYSSARTAYLWSRWSRASCQTARLYMASRLNSFTRSFGSDCRDQPLQKSRLTVSELTTVCQSTNELTFNSFYSTLLSARTTVWLLRRPLWCGY